MGEKKSYVCARCGETFESTVTEAKANQEAETLWGVKNASNSSRMVVVCDDCFQACVLTRTTMSG